MPRIQGADSPIQLARILSKAVHTNEPINPRFVAADIAEWEAQATTDEERNKISRTLKLRSLEKQNQERLDQLTQTQTSSGSDAPTLLMTHEL